jgi:predicted amidohydrolase YtcJ
MRKGNTWARIRLDSGRPSAGMIVFDLNLFEIPPKEIAEMKVVKTVFAGEVVYRH